MPRAMWMPRRRLMSIVLVSGSLGMMIGIGGALLVMPGLGSDADAYAAGLSASPNADIEAAFLNFASAEKFTAAVARPATIDEVFSLSQAGANCKQGTWPYFDRNCLWAASKKQNRARSVVARPTPAIVAAAASGAATTSATSVAVAALHAKRTASTRTGSRTATPKATAKRNLAAHDIEPVTAYSSYAAVPRPAISGQLPSNLQPRFAR